MIGTVSWFDNQKGMGFVQDEGGTDHFIHYKELRKTDIRKLMGGDIIEFEILTGDKGSYVTNVKIVKFNSSVYKIKRNSNPNMNKLKNEIYDSVDNFKETKEDLKFLKDKVFSHIIKALYGDQGLNYFYKYLN